MRYLIALILVLAWSEKTISEEVKAGSFALWDDGLQKTVREGNAREKRQVASLTKVATALVIYRLVDDPGKPGLDDMAEVPHGALLGGVNPLGLVQGDRLSVAAALQGALMASDNVSAHTLAEHFGKGISPADPVGAFVGEMNRLAQTLGMEDTRFANPHGLDLPGEIGESTAADMVLLARAAVAEIRMMRICGQREVSIRVIRRGREISIKINNTNAMLGEMGIDGLKTGMTRRAGFCFIGTARRGEKRLISVVLDSPDRFGETKHLLGLGFAAAE